jgi:GNAT superfamily N-acetyltransferase
VVELDFRDPRVAGRVLEIQRSAYRIEAALIGFDGMPNFADTVEDLQRAELVWSGVLVGGMLVGVAACDVQADGIVDIDRLMVDPPHLRQGIARALLTTALNPSGPTVVSTGTANTPTTALYTSLGFHARQPREIAPRITVTHFDRDPDATIQSTNEHEPMPTSRL